MSVEIRIKDAVKKYGENTVVKNLSLVIKEGEFFTLLGPSGCGKTTLLRMIAGFNSIEGGEFYFNDKVINNIEPEHRNIGMVFQNYAIFPHLTVEQNVEFGLKNKKNIKLSKEEIKQKVDKFLALMQIDTYKDRLPENLSGGQQQRVALARALVISPDVLLMDEPLSNLDAKLRVEMRSAIKDIQHTVGITTVYVTHDQEEAMAVSDRIAVMKDGIIQQIGSPQELYQRPNNVFVSTFIGNTNIIEGYIEKNANKYLLTIFGSHTIEMNNINSDSSIKVKVSIRPEEFYIAENTNSGINGKVLESTFLGLNTHYKVEMADGSIISIVQESKIDKIIAKGSSVRLEVKKEKINVFNEDGSKTLIGGVTIDH